MDHVTLRKQVKTHDDQGNASKSTVTEQKENLSDIWNPAFNEFQFGDSPADVNSHLPNPFDSSKWEDLPQAHENKEDVVKYFWLPLSRFGDKITKFIPLNTTVNEQSYICFLFIHQKLYFISIRLFHDDTHQNYNDIVEAYANAVNTPVIETGHGKEFFYTDDSIIYVAHFHDDKSHILIEVLQKGHSKSDDNTFRQLSLDRERKLSPAQPFIPSQAHKYDIMISYCHRDKELSHRIYYRLLEDKFRVWMDVENMYGPIVERMAESIENSEFVLLLMSNAYKSSSYCQLEAEYAFKYQACLIPLVVKNDFTQTGWLGMLVGLRHHIDFTKTTFDDAYAQLCKELQHFRTQSIEKSQPLKSTE